jgi:hypothetical protein
MIAKFDVGGAWTLLVDESGDHQAGRPRTISTHHLHTADIQPSHIFGRLQVMARRPTLLPDRWRACHLGVNLLDHGGSLPVVNGNV